MGSQIEEELRDNIKKAIDSVLEDIRKKVNNAFEDAKDKIQVVFNAFRDNLQDGFNTLATYTCDSLNLSVDKWYDTMGLEKGNFMHSCDDRTRKHNKQWISCVKIRNGCTTLCFSRKAATWGQPVIKKIDLMIEEMSR